MERERLEELFVSIKEDNLKSFSSIMLSNSDLNIRFGRFPILSLLYLYKSYNILSKYEKLLLPINKFEKVFEPFDAYKKFKAYAKKSLKLFMGDEQIIYPIEMLAVIDDRGHLKYFYKLLFKNEKILENLPKIYNLTHKLNVEVSESSIIVKRKPLSLKQKIVASALCAVFCLISVFSLVSVIFVKENSGLGTKNNPILISSASTLSSISNAKGRYYKLTEDIELSEDFEAEDFNGYIDGDGHTIFADKYLTGGLFKSFAGTLENLTIYANYDNVSVYEDFGVIAQNSMGNIENIQVFCDFSGKTYNDSAIYIAGITAKNSGTIKNVEVKLDANISNERNSDAFVSAIAGENNGEIINSKSVGTKITTNTVDIAGVVAVNYGKVSDCVNETELSQVSAKEWNPNVAGIAMINYGEISKSKNIGVIRSESTLLDSTKSSELIVFAGGITCYNWGIISACENSADIYGKSKIILVYVGGITATCYAQQNTTSSISKSKATGNLYSETESAKTCVGGVVAYTYSLVGSNMIFGITLYSVSEIKNSSFVGNIITNAKTVFAGGLVGENYYGLVNDSYASASFENTRDSSLESNYFNAGLIGGTYSYGSSFLNNNYYVNNETFSVAVSALTYYSNVINVQGLQDSVCSANKIGSLDELPEELKV